MIAAESTQVNILLIHIQPHLHCFLCHIYITCMHLEDAFIQSDSFTLCKEKILFQ